MKKNRKTLLVLALCLTALSLMIPVWCPSSRGHLLHSVALLREGRSLVLSLPEGKELTLHTDTILRTAFFTDPRGLAQTAPLDTARWDTARTLRHLHRERRRLAARSRHLHGQLEEIAYYERTHSVSDEGYHQVMALLPALRREAASTDSLQALVALALESDFPPPYVRRSLTLTFRPTEARTPVRLPCEAEDAARGRLRLAAGGLPAGAQFLPMGLLRLPSPRRLALGYLSWWTQRPDSLLPAPVVPVDTLPALAEGSPVVDGWGRLRGVYAQGSPRPLPARPLSPRLWAQAWLQGWRNLFRPAQKVEPSAYGRLQDRGYLGELRGGLPHGSGRAGGYRGQWARGKRQGEGVWTDSAGTRYSGLWQADTLCRGTRRQADTLYTGPFNARLLPQGQGLLLHPEGRYEGAWREGRPEGFGIGLASGQTVRAGSWAQGRFRGLHMVCSADRVYGIDLSRHQHEKGRRRFAIDWRRLRITRLGSNRNRPVAGETDFPVSFCFIKATQGLRILNRYYAADARQARRLGIAVGAYHFFSPLDGARQADWFLRSARPQRGDLPPVLDVELTPSQIRRMGGPGRMRREMLEWLRLVRARTGVRPILYVSQPFALEHLSRDAALRDYPLWIARYSEYKPHLRLRYWQLSADGRVRGIHGDVDINVFNGSHEQFRDYRQAERVR